MKLHDNGIADFLDISEVGITDGLIAWYPLNGDAKDYTINRNDGTVNGATVAAGLDGKLCYSFDGVDDSIIIGKADELDFVPNRDSFSVSAWYNSSATGVIYSYGGSTGIRQIQIDTTQHGLEVYLGQVVNSQNIISTSLTPGWNDGNWHHVCLTVLGANLAGSFYYDGALITSSLDIGSGVNDTYGAEIGSRTLGTGYLMDGKIQDVRIYNRVLSAEEVKILYDMGREEGPKMKQTNNTLYVNSIDETF